VRNFKHAFAAVAIVAATLASLGADAANCQTPSGVPVPQSDVGRWDFIWSVNFRADFALGAFPGVYGDRLRAYPSNYFDTSKKGQYNPATTMSASCGVLDIHLSTINGRPQVAAPVPYIGGDGKWPGQVYGRYEIRARFPAAIPGYKIAWLLWPDVGTNTTGAVGGGGNGEIDFPESNLKALSSTGGFVHRQGATVGNDQYATGPIPVDMRAWHTYTIEWSPGLVRFLVDGVQVGRTTERVPNTKMHWVWQTETELSSLYPNPATTGDVLIDWASIWRYT